MIKTSFDALERSLLAEGSESFYINEQGQSKKKEVDLQKLDALFFFFRVLPSVGSPVSLESAGALIGVQLVAYEIMKQNPSLSDFSINISIASRWILLNYR